MEYTQKTAGEIFKDKEREMFTDRTGIKYAKLGGDDWLFKLKKAGDPYPGSNDRVMNKKTGVVYVVEMSGLNDAGREAKHRSRMVGMIKLKKTNKRGPSSANVNW